MELSISKTKKTVTITVDEPTVNLKLSKEEALVLCILLSNAVGCGSTSPRKYVDPMWEKLNDIFNIGNGSRMVHEEQNAICLVNMPEFNKVLENAKWPN